jgi:hypothetical protein
MTDDVWSVLIAAIASLSGDVSKLPKDGLNRSGTEWSTCCMLAFRCLKLIVDDFLEQLPPMSDSPDAPRRALLDCCSSFGSSRHDVNISLTAIGLLWSIADLDSHSWSIDVCSHLSAFSFSSHRCIILTFPFDFSPAAESFDRACAFVVRRPNGGEWHVMSELPLAICAPF